MNDRIIPKKNYMIVLIISILTLLLIFGLKNIYEKNQVINNETLDFMSEIKENELKTFIIENHEAIIYLSSSNNETLDSFESKLKNYVLNNNLEKTIVYIDLSKVSDKFYENFNKQYFNNKQIIVFEKEPSLLYIKEGKVVDYLSVSKSKINIDIVKEFVEIHGIQE